MSTGDFSRVDYGSVYQWVVRAEREGKKAKCKETVPGGATVAVLSNAKPPLAISMSTGLSNAKPHALSCSLLMGRAGRQMSETVLIVCSPYGWIIVDERVSSRMERRCPLPTAHCPVRAHRWMAVDEHCCLWWREWCSARKQRIDELCLRPRMNACGWSSVLSDEMRGEFIWVSSWDVSASPWHRPQLFIHYTRSDD